MRGADVDGEEREARTPGAAGPPSPNSSDAEPADRSDVQEAAAALDEPAASDAPDAPADPPAERLSAPLSEAVRQRVVSLASETAGLLHSCNCRRHFARS